MEETVLQFVSDMIDGKLVVCDDGYVIESYVESSRGTKRVDYLFYNNGKLERAEIKGNI